MCESENMATSIDCSQAPWSIAIKLSFPGLTRGHHRVLAARAM
jgi:hypothetical protein